MAIVSRGGEVREHTRAQAPSGCRPCHRSRLERQETGYGYLRVGLFMVKASGRIPFSTWRQLTGAAIGKPARARGDEALMVVVPRPFRR
jgi:hypothetical protein